MEELQNRITKLFQRLEKIDVELITTLFTQIKMKRSTKLYFKAVGRLSAYHSITKGLKCERIVDYLGIAVCKMRVQQVLNMIKQQDIYDKSIKTVESKELYTNSFKMFRSIEIDKYFNLD